MTDPEIPADAVEAAKRLKAGMALCRGPAGSLRYARMDAADWSDLETLVNFALSARQSAAPGGETVDWRVIDAIEAVPGLELTPEEREQVTANFRALSTPSASVERATIERCAARVDKMLADLGTAGGPFSHSNSMRVILKDASAAIRRLADGEGAK